ncbi:hypothetical protein AVEN_140107-1 [Araneus ventricosus]|uniref:Uncharacterized protein n=1 Tax=Araneus ventricosus TaxID=182803 RepID=A0A4Y2LAV3_ARAVE|nr:hypothetical protein AVEN_140107-1 [Araneus ventricosus]
MELTIVNIVHWLLFCYAHTSWLLFCPGKFSLITESPVCFWKHQESHGMRIADRRYYARDHYAKVCPVTKPFHFKKPSAENLSSSCEDIVEKIAGTTYEYYEDPSRTKARYHYGLRKTFLASTSN